MQDPGTPVFSTPGASSDPLEPGRFHPFPSARADLRLAAVDWGNLEVLRAPNFSVHFVRVAWSLFRGGRRCTPARVPARMEFFAIARDIVDSGQILFRI